jgi:hypothetical protein
MRRSAVLAIAVLFLTCAVEARAQRYEPAYERIRAGLVREPDRVAMARGVMELRRRGETRTDLANSRASERRERATRPERAGGAASEGACRGVRGAKPLGYDSVWDGLLIGAGIGAGGGYFWARNICGSNDAECFAIAAPAGVLGGAAIGAAVGAVLDAFSK